MVEADLEMLAVAFHYRFSSLHHPMVLLSLNGTRYVVLQGKYPDKCD